MIERHKLKHNFLKTIIIRVDLFGVFPQEIEEIVVGLKSYFKCAGFQRFYEKRNNQFDVEITGTGMDDQSPQSQVKLTENYKIYNFTNEDNGISIDISHLFICVTVNSTNYIVFSDYLEHLITVYKKFVDKIDFLTVNRVGLRKINSCLFKDKTKIADLFSTKYCNFGDFQNEKCLSSNQKYLLNNENRKINVSTNVQEGELENNLVYQFVLDTDIYISDYGAQSDFKIIENEFLMMNDIIFEIYIESMTEMFISKLTSESEFELEYLIGVDRNE